MMTARRCMCLVLGVWLATSGAAFSQNDDEHLGLIEYEVACMPCHGIDGRGRGPVASSLKAQPTDLTLLARSNNGRFPRVRVIQHIDGRAVVAAHGPRDMPVWGDRYRRHVTPGQTSHDVDRRARVQIDALMRYLETIQVK